MSEEDDDTSHDNIFIESNNVMNEEDDEAARHNSFIEKTIMK